jgi:hypothetical protein
MPRYTKIVMNSPKKCYYCDDAPDFDVNLKIVWLRTSYFFYLCAFHKGIPRQEITSKYKETMKRKTEVTEAKEKMNEKKKRELDMDDLGTKMLVKEMRIKI